MTRLIRLVGADPDYLYFETPSWSGKDEAYDLLLDRRTGDLSCSCFGSMRWRKTLNIMNPDLADSCKHMRGCMRRFQDIMDEGQKAHDPGE